MSGNDRKLLVTGLSVVAVGGVAWVGYKFSQTAVPESDSAAGNMNSFSLRFWTAIWSAFYRLDPRTVTGIIHWETAGNPASFTINEPNGTKSYGPMHVNDVNLASLGYDAGNPPSDVMRGIQAGCRLLRRQLSASGDYQAAVAQWNPGQSSYFDDVNGWLVSTYGAGVPA